MNDKHEYIALKNKFLNILNAENHFKYTAFMRLSFYEFTSLMSLFPLSEITEYLSKDTGVKINYGSIWSAYNATKNRIIKSKDAPIEISSQTNKSPEKDTVVHHQSVKEIKSSTKTSHEQNYDWLYDGKYSSLTQHEVLVNLIKKNNLTEKDLDSIKPNLYNPTQIVKQLIEYAYAKESNRNNDDIFGVSE